MEPVVGQLQGLEAADAVARLAVCALVREVTLTPKPGLVDERSNGAHADMDVTTFLASAVALKPHFVACARAGLAHGDAPVDPSLVARLRAIGRDAELDMFDATGGVNTHKGANYSFSLILAATGMELARMDGTDTSGIEVAAGRSLSSIPSFTAEQSERVLRTVAAMGRAVLDADLTRVRERAEAGEQLSHGEQLFLKRGVTGVRGESAAGYPALREVLLPYLRSRASSDSTTTLLRAMVRLMASLEDTNLLHRGGADGLAWARAEAARIRDLDLGRSELVAALREMDVEFTRRNLSPGGTADLLSLGIYFASLEGLM